MHASVIQDNEPATKTSTNVNPPFLLLLFIRTEIFYRIGKFYQIKNAHKYNRIEYRQNL